MNRRTRSHWAKSDLFIEKRPMRDVRKRSFYSLCGSEQRATEITAPMLTATICGALPVTILHRVASFHPAVESGRDPCPAHALAAWRIADLGRLDVGDVVVGRHWRANGLCRFQPSRRLAPVGAAHRHHCLRLAADLKPDQGRASSGAKRKAACSTRGAWLQFVRAQHQSCRRSSAFRSPPASATNCCSGAS